LPKFCFAWPKLLENEFPDGVEFDVTNEDLARAANVTIFTVCRLMSEWQRTGGVVKAP